jgi:hypothetical protein
MPHRLFMMGSKGVEEFLAFDAFVFPHGPQDGIRRSDAKALVGRDCHTLMSGLFGLQNDVAAFLMDDSIAPVPAKHIDEIVPAQIAWDLHPLARISSRTK